MHRWMILSARSLFPVACHQGLLSEAPELELTFNDDGSVTSRWEKQEAGEWWLTETHIEPEEEIAPS